MTRNDAKVIRLISASAVQLQQQSIWHTLYTAWLTRRWGYLPRTSSGNQFNYRSKSDCSNFV